MAYKNFKFETDADGIALVTYLQWLGTVQAGIPVAERVTP